MTVVADHPLHAAFERHRYHIGAMLNGDDRACRALLASEDAFHGLLYHIYHDTTVYPARRGDGDDAQHRYRQLLTQVAMQHPQWILALLGSSWNWQLMEAELSDLFVYLAWITDLHSPVVGELGAFALSVIRRDFPCPESCRETALGILFNLQPPGAWEAIWHALIHDPDAAIRETVVMRAVEFPEHCPPATAARTLHGLIEQLADVRQQVAVVRNARALLERIDAA